MAVSEFLNDPGLFVFKYKDGIFCVGIFVYSIFRFLWTTGFFSNDW